ncbi:TspO/MBR family protein [Bartonella tamiae]|uniref:Tryptophan-rich sensory protein n=1 Tax=Bartonella tamiae Th239 TaxID=1094558 RepID=J0QTN4_9HYPH|nr:TspO/MBR family protein [Bartonella tamiae]EJF89271.1 hypothetical protein ME5_01822 [Bartonella tamiae Th239]EJF95567.1 hypothetical protein MEG_00057 [Bartonella tamiae Th307]
MKKWFLLIVFIILVVGIGSFIGFSTSPASWYAALNKPPFTPPNAFFAPIWITLYVLIAIAGWRVYVIDFHKTLWFLWIIQILLNFSWSPVFFGMKMMETALLICLVLFITVAGFIILSWKRDRISALMFIPYIIWLGLANYLNAGVIYLNIIL